MRPYVLLGVLVALAGVFAWNSVRLERPAVRATAEPAPERIAADASDVSLARFPGRVADAAGALGHFRGTLERQADAMMEDLGIEVHVVAVSLESPGVDVLAPEIFQQRRIGEGSPTGGLLILLNPLRREARIETSYALEGVLPDALLGRMAEDQLAPYVAYGAAGMAVMDVIHQLSDFVMLRAIRGDIRLAEAYTSRPAFAKKARFLSGGAGAAVPLPDIAALGASDPKARVPDERRGRYAPSSDPLESTEAFLRVLRDLAGDPSLELFTEGSRCMRRGYPFAPFESLERLRSFEASRPFRVIELGDRAVVTADHRAPGFVPVLLHRVDGLWRVDVVEVWKNLFFGRDGDYRQNNSNHPYAFGLGAFGEGEFHDLAAWDLGGEPIDRVLDRLESRKGALDHFLQGEVLYRNCWLVLDAFRHYEEAVRLAPTAPLFLETLGDRAEYVNFHALALSVYEKLGNQALLKTARAHAALGELEPAIEWSRRAVERNPYDLAALRALSEFLEQKGEPGEARTLDQRIAELIDDPGKRFLPPVLTFDPPRPTLEIDAPTRVGKTTIYDHSAFSVTMANPSARPVEILSVQLSSLGTGNPSGLGNIVGYWPFRHGDRWLAQGQALTFDKTWGFRVDTGHEQLSYVFDVCWRGEGDVKQCRSHRLDLFPR